jgi:trimethylamine--corrinoid protein Co-methyltransferase
LGALTFLSRDEIEEIHSGSLQLLEKTGVVVKNDLGLQTLRKAGCETESNRVRIPSDLVEASMKKAPASFDLHSREGTSSLRVGGENTIFDPGSSGTEFLDSQTGEIRPAQADDLAQLVRLADGLEYIDAQSTAVVPSDVPESISDLFRLYIVLRNSGKPIVTGAFTKQGLIDMVHMLEAVAGGRDKLAQAPRAIFDCCPTSPLSWGDVACQNLIDCAANSIPAEIIPAPMMGATSPVSIFGTLVQSNAEILSGIVITQAVRPRTPIVYGGSLALFDMKRAMICLGAIETAMAACASAQIGKYHGLPTHAYLGLSESKVIDSQSGFESGIGLVLAALARINVVSGPGMMAFENCLSLEKLAIDNDICGMSRRLVRGIEAEDTATVLDLVNEVGPGGDFLSADHTLAKLRQEQFMPSDVVCRRSVNSWKEHGSKDSRVRARERVEKILATHNPESMPRESNEILEKTMKDILRRHGIPASALPRHA